MYANDLGRFVNPAPGMWHKNPKHPILDLEYIPERPVAVRGAFNPWELERTRELFNAEEKVWKQVQAQQAHYRTIVRLSEEAVKDFNRKIAQLEQLTGKKTKGMFSADNIVSFVAGAGGNPYIMAALAIKMGVQMMLGNQKKKKINRLISELEALQKQLIAWNGEMEVIIDRVSSMIQISDQVRAAQASRIAAVVQRSGIMATRRADLDRMQAEALAERNRQAAFLQPTRQRGYDDL